MQYDLIQDQVHEPFKVGNPAIFNSYFLRHLQCELATDHTFLLREFYLIDQFFSVLLASLGSAPPIKKGKEEYLYSAFLYTMYISKHSGIKRHPIAAYYSFINPEGIKGLVGWPIADGLPVTRQLQVERRTGKDRRRKTDVLPLCHATNPCTCSSCSTAVVCCSRSNAGRATWVQCLVPTTPSTWSTGGPLDATNIRSSDDSGDSVTYRFHTACVHDWPVYRVSQKNSHHG